MKISMFRFLTILLMAAFLAACGSSAGSPTATPGTPVTVVTAAGTAQAGSTSASASPAALTVMTHDSFAASEGVIRQFEQDNHVKLVFLKSGDAGAALNRAILSK